MLALVGNSNLKALKKLLKQLGQRASCHHLYLAEAAMGTAVIAPLANEKSREHPSMGYSLTELALDKVSTLEFRMNSGFLELSV